MGRTTTGVLPSGEEELDRGGVGGASHSWCSGGAPGWSARTSSWVCVRAVTFLVFWRSTWMER